MSSPAEQFRRTEEIFRAAARLDPSLRERYIQEQASGDPRLLAQLRALLSADDLPSGVLDQPALGRSGSMEVVQAAVFAADTLPERIGHYRIIRVIGSGGMGVVYEAEQDQPSRRVALKVIRPGITSASLLRRFRREAQMLGRLQHPGIAQIYEASTDAQGGTGQPYFAMELVNGRPLFEHAQSLGLGTRQRLELLALVCDAVHHAHLHGVIHRDLKPANILVTDESREPGEHGQRGDAQPKVLDFGIARSIENDVLTVSAHTGSGELVGTIAYMSPEQAAGDPSRIDVRSDVYALGVIAYELISGRMPYEVHGRMIHEAVHVIRENEPSRLSSINRAFRGDLETVISKALEKDPARRYPSAAEFASDIRRFLREQPIAARPASQLYQLRKFAQRNRAVVAGVAVAFAALVIGTAVAVQQAVTARAAAAEARRQTYRASLVAASSALRYHEIGDARHQLENAPEELRGWEWAQLSSRLDDSLRALDVKFTPMCMAISPDGGTVVSCNSGGKIKSWRVSDLTPIAEHNLTGSTQRRRVSRLVFSPDGRELRADTPMGSTWLDAASMKLFRSDDLALESRSDDGKFGIAVDRSNPGRASVVEVLTGRELFSFDKPVDLWPRCAFSPNGKQLAAHTAGNAGLSVFRTEDGAAVWSRPDLDQVLDLSYSMDGTKLVVGCGTGAVVVLDAATGRELVTLTGHNSPVTAVGFSPDAAFIATASNDRTVRLWRTNDGSQISAMHGSAGAFSELVFPPTIPGSQPAFATLAADRHIRWWDAGAASDPFVLRTPGTVYAVAFSPDGTRIASASLVGERPLRIWNIASQREEFAGSEGNLSTLAFNQDGSLLAIGRSTTDKTSILDAKGQPIASWSGHWWRTNWVNFGTDGQLWSLGNGGRLIAQDINTGEQLRIKKFPAQTSGEGCRAAISPDQSIMAVASGGQIRLLDFKTWNDIATLNVPGRAIYALSFSPDGTQLVSGGTDHTLRVWNVASRRVIATMPGHSDEIYATIFSPDGRRLVSAGRDRVIRIWCAETFESLTPLYGHTSLVYCLAFSPDGQTLASGGGDATVRLWDTRTYRERVKANQSEAAAERQVSRPEP